MPEESKAGNRYTMLLLLWLMVPLITIADIHTGPMVDTSVFYLVPISIVTWRYDFFSGIAIMLVCVAAVAITQETWNVRIGMDGNYHFMIYNAVSRIIVWGMITYILDLLYKSYQKMKSLARTDSLTGAANTRFFYEVAEAEFERSRRQASPITIAYIDLDNFKQMNDTFGHHAGDNLLRIVTGTLRSSLRKNDTVGRLGGDEFVLLLPDTGCDAAQSTLERARQALLSAFKSESWPVTVSIGAVTYHYPPDSVDEASKRADSLMYEIKAAGKNGIKLKEVKTDRFNSKTYYQVKPEKVSDVNRN